MSAALAPGFADPVLDGQDAFRALLAALSRPGIPVPLASALVPPRPLTPELAAVALALADPDAPLWLDPALAAVPEVTAYLRFHTGARIVAAPYEAAFALVSDPRTSPAFAELSLGTDEYPDRSTTLVVAVAEVSGASRPVTLAGPGIRDRVAVAISPPPADLAANLRTNAATFPRGIDLLFVAPGAVLGIPRSSRLVGEGG